MYKLPVVFVFLAAAIVLTLVAFYFKKSSKESPVIGLLPWINAVLNAGALVAAVYLMVNQIGYVIAKLDSINTIMAFIIFEAVMLVAVIVNIIASFFPMGKQA